MRGCCSRGRRSSGHAIARMRDQLAHHYFDTDHAVVRDVVDNELGPLLTAVRSLINRVVPDDDS